MRRETCFSISVLRSGLSLQPPRSHYSNIEANESEEVRQFRKLFVQLAGDVSILCGRLTVSLDCDNPEVLIPFYGIQTPFHLP